MYCRSAGPQLIALAGITISLALGASIPVESLCGLPGIGQLAWQAALSRDLPLLVNLTVLVTLVTLLANSGADVMIQVLKPSESSEERGDETCMKVARVLACVIIVAVCALSLGANWLAPAGYAKQFREQPMRLLQRAHLLGTDEVGRDRFARVLYGTRISLLLAPAAALVSTALAALVGGLAGYLGGVWLRLARASPTSFSRCLGFFSLLPCARFCRSTFRQSSPSLITFLILGVLGWAASARVLSTSADALRNSDFVLQARASGMHGPRLFLIHVLPNLKPVLYAQFWISIPVFI